MGIGVVSVRNSGLSAPGRQVNFWKGLFNSNFLIKPLHVTDEETDSEKSTTSLDKVTDCLCAKV